jgi:hypothetical protein
MSKIAQKMKKKTELKFAISFDREKLNFEDERRVWRNFGARAGRAVGQIGRNLETTLLADAHSHETLKIMVFIGFIDLNAFL